MDLKQDNLRIVMDRLTLGLKLLELIKQKPGVTTEELINKSKGKRSSVHNALKTLSQQGQIIIINPGKKTRKFALTGYGEDELKMHNAIQSLIKKNRKHKYIPEAVLKPLSCSIGVSYSRKKWEKVLKDLGYYIGGDCLVRKF